MLFRSLLRLSRVLREHVQVWRTAGEDDPQPVDFGLKKESAKKDKTTKRVAKK